MGLGEPFLRTLVFLLRLKITGVLGTEEDHDLTHLLTATTSLLCEEEVMVEHGEGPGTVRRLYSNSDKILWW